MAVDVMKVISVDFLLDIVKKQRTVDYTNAKNMGTVAVCDIASSNLLQ